MFKKALVIFALSCLGGGAFTGYAYSTRKGDQPETRLSIHASAPKKLTVIAETDAGTFTNTSFLALAVDRITVPATGNYVAVVRFSAESACDAVSWCTARVLVDGVEANPKVESDFAFDSPGGETWQSLSMDRTSDVIAGTGSVRNVAVEVDIAVLGGGSWRLDDWSVVAELFKV
jgi:hypothetical protein